MKALLTACLLALALAGGPLGASEYEDLGDKFYLRGNFEQAIRWYRKAIASSLPKDALWQKYDASVKAVLLERGEVRPAAPKPSELPDQPPPTAAAASPTASQPVSAPPEPPATSPSGGPPALTPPVEPPKPQTVVYRPGERVSLMDPVSPGSPAPPAVIDGGNYRIESVEIGYDASGAVTVRGQLVNTGDTFLQYPRVYVSVFDKQDLMRGRNAATLPAGTTTLPPGQSTEFNVKFVTYKGPVSSYSAEVTGSR